MGRIVPYGARMSSPEVTSAILAADRRTGALLRDRVASVPGGHEYARLAADVMAPAFQGLVLALIVLPGSRVLGVRAGAAGAMAGLLARVARDAIDRPRPGTRTEGGFPSRHAASATAITLVVAREKRVLGALAMALSSAGLVARVGAADHEPLDVAAGAGVGAVVARIMRRRRRRRG
jgi:membrane-associated phospholipid phosphatase